MALIEHSLPGIEYPDDALSVGELLDKLHNEPKLVNDRLRADTEDFYQHAVEYCPA